ncbi:hypothetical protein [Kribbella sp. NPDC003557]|uniref:hypothetical protein n=1 Tax=Kribbella sp. NPDC003557 TaxID=3154449 RepID=UPI0033A9BF09
MTPQPIILICDDNPERAKRWTDAVTSMPGTDRFDVKTLSGQELADAVEGLNRRREALRPDEDGNGPDAAEARRILAGISDAAVFDTAAIALIDYDLTPDSITLGKLEEKTAEHVLDRLRNRSGESIAYLARCYSDAGFLVVINQRFKEATFDITMQRFSDSYADLNISQADLRSKALWSGVSDIPGEFHPWSWPVLCKADLLWRARLAATELSAPVLESLNLNGERFSARQLDLLGEVLDVEDVKEVTFDHLVDTSLGLTVKDGQPDPECRRAIAASVASRWLEQTVLPGQNALADLAHLVIRHPQLGGSAARAAEEWNRFATKQSRAEIVANGGAAAEAVELLQSIEPAAEQYLSRPAWSATKVRGLAAGLPEPDEWPDLAFCEDTSRFIPLDSAQEVETDVPGPYARRFVEAVEGVRYDPLRRML